MLDDDGPELVAGSPREDSSRWASSPNHFSRIANELAGFDVARARRAYRGALSSRDRHRARRLAGILYDVDILCARLDVKGDLKSEVSRTVEAYYTGAKRSGTGARSEAVLTAITLEVLNRRAWGDADLADAAFTVFNITPTQRHLATMRIRDWFNQNSEWRK